MNNAKITWVECRNTSIKGIISFYIKIYGGVFLMYSEV